MSLTPAERARMRAGVSLNEISARVGRTAKHLREMERGTKPVPYPLAERLAALYGCRMEDLLTNTRKPK